MVELIPTSFDYETHLIRPGYLAPRPVCLAVADITAGGAELFIGQDRMIALANKLLGGKRLLIGANVSYDLGVMAASAPELVDLIFDALDNNLIEDILINQQMLDNCKGHLGGVVKNGKIVRRYYYSQAGLELRLLKRDRSSEKGEDTWRLRYGELDGLSKEQWPEEAKQYPKDDAIGCLEVWWEQQQELEEWAPNRHEQVRAAFALHLSSCWGVHTCPNQINRLEQSIKGEYEKLTDQLKEIGLLRKNNTKNTMEAKRLMLLSSDSVRLTAKGVEKFEQEYIDTSEYNNLSEYEEPEWLKYVAIEAKTCEASGNEILQAYAHRTTLARVMDSTIPDLRKGVDAPIQPRYNVFLETGRTSCFKDSKSLNGFQIQNVMRHISKEHEEKGIGIRECFKARPGMVFIDCDFGQLELCCVAQVIIDQFGESTLANIINTGEDVHYKVLATILGCNYQDILDNLDDPEVKSKRVLAKIANFGFWGGLGGPGIVGFALGYGVQLSVAEGRELKEQWMESMYPDPQRYFAWVRDAIPPGEERIPLQIFRNNVIRGNVKYTAACNGEFQALGAAVSKSAMYEVTKQCYRSDGILPGVRPWAFVHDQIISEAPEENSKELALIKSDIMIKAAKKHLPNINIKCDPARSKYWFKGAEGVDKLWFPKEWPYEQ